MQKCTMWLLYILILTIEWCHCESDLGQFLFRFIILNVNPLMAAIR